MHKMTPGHGAGWRNRHSITYREGYRQYAKGRDGLEKSPLYYPHSDCKTSSLHLRRFVTMRVPAGFDRRASGEFFGTQTPNS